MRPRRTKIVATLGPACAQRAVLERMVRAGVDVVRLNFSHGSATSQASLVAEARAAARAADREIALLADLAGPKIRLGELEGTEPLLLERGDEVVLTSRRVKGRQDLLPVRHRALARDLAPGRQVLLADGTVVLEVLAVADADVRCRVVGGGPVRSRAGVNLPDSEVTARNPGARDLEDAGRAVELGADWLALSFVQAASELNRLRRHLARSGASLPLVAKIEKPQAVERLSAILDATDAAMVARGDLGVECAPEDVPMLQKKIILEANRRAIPVITATQMLESMKTELRPTRAEASDVANAILDGTDAVMLSAETATGRHPVASVRMMDAIARRTETSEAFALRFAHEGVERAAPGDVTEAVAQAARQAAEHAGAGAMIVHSETGESARRVARQRPSMPVVVLAPETATVRRLQLVQGLRALKLRRVKSTDRMVEAGLRLVRDAGLVPSGTLVVIVAGSQPLVAASNMMKLSRIP